MEACDREEALKLAPELWEADCPHTIVKLCVHLKTQKPGVSLATAAMSARLVRMRDLTDEIETVACCIESAACRQDPSLTELFELHHELGVKLREARLLRTILHEAYPELYPA